MTLSYLPRLICLVFACFFLVYLAASLLIALSVPRALRFAARLPAGAAARFVLALRLLPMGLAALAALGLCLPSYLWFEPELIDEQVGPVCLLLALVGAASLAYSLIRAARMLIASATFSRRCASAGHPAPQGEATLIIESSHPFLALTGIVRPQVVISQIIVDTLSREEMAVVLNHENAHRASKDNLKRLCISFAPGLKTLERAWTRYAEYAADDEAVAGNRKKSLALASALVRVARFAHTPAPAAVTSFLGDATDLKDRIDRLIDPAPSKPSSPRMRPAWAPALMAAALVAIVALNSSMFRFVQAMLEHLVR